MKKPKKPPVKPKGGGASGSGAGTGKRGIGPGKARGVKRRVTSIPGRGAKASGGTGGGGGPVHKTAKPPKRRQWSPGSDVACCSAEALGFLLGWDVDEVLRLYWRTASDPDAGATVADTLAAAGRRAFPAGERPPNGTAGLILGVQLAKPHAIAVTPDGRWWSWGESFSPGDWPELIIDESWAVLL